MLLVGNQPKNRINLKYDLPTTAETSTRVFRNTDQQIASSCIGRKIEDKSSLFHRQPFMIYIQSDTKCNFMFFGCSFDGSLCIAYKPAIRVEWSWDIFPCKLQYLLLFVSHCYCGEETGRLHKCPRAVMSVRLRVSQSAVFNVSVFRSNSLYVVVWRGCCKSRCIIAATPFTCTQEDTGSNLSGTLNIFADGPCDFLSLSPEIFWHNGHKIGHDSFVARPFRLIVH